jgi:PAS domain-containing protein
MALNIGNDRNKRRRRRRSTQAFAQAQPAITVRRPIQTSYMEILASVGIVVAAIALIALIWITVARSGDNYRSVLQARIEATVSGQAQILATEVRREMLNVAQSLNILKRAYQADPDHFDLQAWQAQMPALTDVSSEVFVADNELVIEQDTNKASAGLGVGANLGDLSNEVTERATRTDDLIVGPAIDRVKERQHVALMFVPLEKPGGWYVGATYKTDALSRMYSEASLGLQGLVALINTRMGRIEIISGPAATNPNYDIASSAMYQALKTKPNGAWVGPSAPDGVERINGFHQVPGRDLAVVVAVDRQEALEQAETWAGWARGLAWAGTLVVLMAAALLLYGVWTYRTTHRLRQTLDRERAVLGNTQAELTEVQSRLEMRTGQVQALFAGVDEGTLVTDADLRATEWNPRFPALFGSAPQDLQIGQPLDELLRIQAKEGAFGPLDDIEVEIGRRMAQLRAAAGDRVVYVGRGGRLLAVAGRSLPDGGLILVILEAHADELAGGEMPAMEASSAPGG